MVRRGAAGGGDALPFETAVGAGRAGDALSFGLEVGGALSGEEGTQGAGMGFPRPGGKARAGAVAFETRAGLPCRVCLGALSGMPGGVFARMGGNLERAGFITIPSRGAAWGYPQ